MNIQRSLICGNFWIIIIARTVISSTFRDFPSHVLMKCYCLYWCCRPWVEYILHFQVSKRDIGKGRRQILERNRKLWSNERRLCLVHYLLQIIRVPAFWSDLVSIQITGTNLLHDITEQIVSNLLSNWTQDLIENICNAEHRGPILNQWRHLMKWFMCKWKIMNTRTMQQYLVLI